MKYRCSKRLLAVLITAAMMMGIFSTLTVAVSAADTAIYYVSVTNVATPVACNTPSGASVNSDMYYVSGVMWYDATTGDQLAGDFQANHAYRVDIYLYANDGYAFASTVSATVNVYNNGEVTRISDKEIKISYAYDTIGYREISTASISVAEPVSGETPSYTATTGYDFIHVQNYTSGDYVAGVAWYDYLTGTALSPTDTFEVGRGYRVKVRVEIDENCVFANNRYLMINGIGSTNTTISERVVEVSAYLTCPAILNRVDASVTKPVAWEYPADAPTSLTEGLTEEAITWLVRVEENGMASYVPMEENTPFLPGKSYMMQMMVRVQTGYRFDVTDTGYPVGTAWVNRSQASLTKWGDNDPSRYAMIYTGFTVPGTELDSVNLTFNQPAAGEYPTYAPTNAVSGVTVESVEWAVREGDAYYAIDENTAFQPGKSYMLTVNVKAAGNNTFTVSNGYPMMDAYINGDQASVTTWVQDGDTMDPAYYATLYVGLECPANYLNTVYISVEPPLAGSLPATVVNTAVSGLLMPNVQWMKRVTTNGTPEYVRMDTYEKFVYGESYLLSFELYNNSNYLFPVENGYPAMTVYVNGEQASVTTLNDGDPSRRAYVYVGLESDAYLITDVDVDGVTKPATGATPDTTVDISSDLYTFNRIQWADVTDSSNPFYLSNSSTFVGGHIYQAEITLQAQGQHRFRGGETWCNVTGTVNGFLGKVTPAEGDGTRYVTLTYTFAPCDITDITEIDLPIMPPVIGDAPDYTAISGDSFYSSTAIDDPEYCLNGISWFDVGANIAFVPGGDGTFQENTEYQVVIYIEARDGYNFSEDLAVLFNGTYGEIVMRFDTAVLATFYFDKTDCTHTVTLIPEQAPTCGEDGIKAHYRCTKCDLMFQDENGENLLDDNDDWLIIPSVDHEFTDWTPVGVMSYTHSGTCVCGETVVEDCVIESSFVAGPSNFSEYDVNVHACSICGWVDYIEVLAPETEPECSHTLGRWTKVDGVYRHRRTCECGEVVEEEACSIEATVLASENILRYTCKVCYYSYDSVLSVLDTNVMVDEDKHLSIEIPGGSAAAFPEDSVLETDVVAGNKVPAQTVDTLKQAYGSDYMLVLTEYGLDIKTHESIEVNLGGTVKVTLPTPVLGYAMNTYQVVGLDDYGTVTFYWPTDNYDGTMSFETDTLGEFYVVGDPNMYVGEAAFKGASLSVGRDLSMTYTAAFDDSLFQYGASVAVIFTMNDQQTVIYASSQNASGRWVFTFNGITPQCMADNICAELVLISDDGTSVVVLDAKEEYSVKANVQGLLTKNASNTKLVQLLTDMLTYGTVSQQYKAYHTDNLATDGVTGMCAPSVLLPDATADVLTRDPVLSSGNRFTAASVRFDNVNSLMVQINAATDVKVVVKEGTKVIDTRYYSASAERYALYTDGIYAIDFGRVYTFELYADDVLVQTMTYSINTYVYRNMNKTDAGGALTLNAQLCRALYRYGASAEAYAAG